MVLVSVLLLGMNITSGSSNRDLAPVPITSVEQPKLTYWFHPTGASCPAYVYDPNKPGDPENAKKTCEQANNTSCVSTSSTAGPGC